MVERQTPRDAASPVVTDHGKTLEPERTHDGQLIEDHGALGVGAMVRASWWLATLPVATKIRANDGEALGEDWRDAMPAGVRLWIAVEQTHRGALTSMHEIDFQ